jgi:hypothetical protein
MLNTTPGEYDNSLTIFRAWCMPVTHRRTETQDIAQNNFPPTTSDKYYNLSPLSFHLSIKYLNKRKEKDSSKNISVWIPNGE